MTRTFQQRTWFAAVVSLCLNWAWGLPAVAGSEWELKAFPSAEGMGKYASGGRGGVVRRVTNLNDSGPGSLRAALEASGRRTVVFAIAGTIWLESPLVVRYGNLTVAGQTAPGGGICIAGNELTLRADNVVLRYLRVRPGDGAGTDVDAISVTDGDNVIIDHCSTSWAVDETLSVSSLPNKVTIQWCLISEGLHNSVHSSGDPHSKGSLVNGEFGARYSFHHNLYAHQSDRCPQIGNRRKFAEDPEGPVYDFRNNVVYNWGSPFDGWEAAGQNRNSDSVSRYNFVDNAYIPGPTTAPAFKFFEEPPYIRFEYWAFEELCPRSQAHFSGNTMDGALWDDAWKHVYLDEDVSPEYKQAVPFAFSGYEVPAEDAFVAYERVVASAGASLRRDAVDARIIADVVNRTGGLVDRPEDVGGWPDLAGAAPPVDSDGDGMPDAWELARGLEPGDPRDAPRDRDGDGYSNIEEYVHGLVDDGFSFEVTTSHSGEGSVVLGTGGEVPRNGSVSVDVVPDPYWSAAAVTVDGEDATAGVNDGRLEVDGVVGAVHIHVDFAPNMTIENATPHWWLARYGATTDFETAAALDGDGDGLAAWQEYRLGTSPLDPSSGLHTDLLVVDGGGTVTPVLRYRRPVERGAVETIVEMSLGGTAWEPVSPGDVTIVDDGDERFETIIIEGLPAGHRRVFFRVRYVFS